MRTPERFHDEPYSLLAGAELDDVLGAEAYVPVVPYNEREQSRLERFASILQRVNEAERTLHEDGKSSVFGYVRDGQPVGEPIMTMDERYVDTWKHRAFNLYYDEFRGDERMKEAALDIAYDVKEQYQHAMTPRDLSQLWERTY